MFCLPKRRNKIGERQNIQMTFLILLMEEDYMKLPRYCFLRSNKDRILMNRGNFPGTLYIRHYADIQLPELKKQFIIEGHPLPKQLYVRLPKENIYVPYESYSTKYLNSKLAELRDLFIHLKAKTIKITKTEIVGKKIGANGNISARNIGIGAGFNNEANIQNEFKEELHFDNDNKPVDTSLLFSNEVHDDIIDATNYVKPKFYYLPQEYEWDDIIDRRLNNKLVKDKYTYYYSDTRILKANVMNKLKIFEINIDIENNEHRELKIEYDIEYHPLVVVEPEPLAKNIQNDIIAKEKEQESSIFQFPKLEIGKKHERKVTMKKSKILNRVDSNRSFKDMVLEIMHVHPKIDMNTPSPSPSDLNHIELEVNEVIRGDASVYVLKKAHLENDIHCINNVNELFEDDKDDVLPKPSFPERNQYDKNASDPDIDKLILPDVQIESNLNTVPEILDAVAEKPIIVVQKVRRKKPKVKSM